MDNIDRAMKEAERLGFGVSYGKYRAAYPSGSAGVLPSPRKSAVPQKPAASCVCCGKPFVRTHASQVYCSEECRYIVFRKRQNDYARRKTAAPLVAMCAICGADFKPKSRKSKYCCKECAHEGSRKVAALWRAAHKKGAADGVSL